MHMARDCVQKAIYLRRDQISRLGGLARAKRVSAAAIIRAAVDRELDEIEALPGDAVPSRVVEQLRLPGGLRLPASDSTNKQPPVKRRRRLKQKREANET